MIRTRCDNVDRVQQGDIIRDVDLVERVDEISGVIEVRKIRFPLIIVLTQDCDLEQDAKFRLPDSLTQDKQLLSVLVAPLYNLAHVLNGMHLTELGLKMEPISKKTPGRYLLNNERARFHYLDFPVDVPIVPSVIDFKHYFSVNEEYLRERKRSAFVCTVSFLYREDVSHRFASFLARIALPDPQIASIGGAP